MVETFLHKRVLQLLGILISGLILLFLLTSPTKPWEDSGRLVLLVTRAPNEVSELVMGLGIDDVYLLTKEGKEKKVTIRSRRFFIQPHSTTLTIILDTDAPAREYQGFGFMLSSPELRNSTNEETPPTHVTLPHETVFIPSPFTIGKDMTSSIILSFETETAMHEENSGKTYLPVIQVETRDGVSLGGDDTSALVEGGSVTSIGTYGMDWSGRVRFNYRAGRREDEIPQGEYYEPTDPTIYNDQGDVENASTSESTQTESAVATTTIEENS